MNLRQWCQLDEAIYIAETDEEYKQYAGFNYSEKLIEQLAELKLSNSKIFVNSFSDQRSLLIGAIEDIALSKTKKLELELHKTRNTKIVSSRHKFNDSLVNWSTWRQFNSLEKNDSNRKEVFDEFVEKTRYISAIVEDRFSSIKQVYREYEDVKYRDTRSNGNKISPLSGYLEDENISYNKLLEFVKSIGDRAKKPFRYALNEIGTRILGRKPEYYDDFYYLRNKVFSDMAISLLSIDRLVEVKKLLEYMEFDTNKIHFDTENRKNKYPSPICFFVQIPDDIRVLYKKESPYFDLQGCFHESGHAIHANSIGKNNEYWDKYRIPMGITEIFSILLERLTKNGSYLRSLHWSSNNNVDDIVDELNLRNEFMELFFVTFYTANSLMKLEYWNKNLSLEESCSMYSRLIKEYTGFEVPGEYWLLHHILPEAIMYVPSYLLAAVRAAELDLYMRNTFGDKWWTEVEAGKELKEIMEPGAKIDLSRFSKLDSNIFVEEITRQI
ncbi:MAG: hypothetical protein WAK17_13340 [Candidatus Nitrosopolaris sp.]